MTIMTMISVMGMIWNAFTAVLAANMHIIAIILMIMVPILVNSLFDDMIEES